MNRAGGTWKRLLAFITRENVGKLWRYYRLYGIRNTARIAVRRFLLLSRRPPACSVPPLSIVQRLSAQPARHFDETVSVIIPTRNAGCDIGVLIRTLKGQEGVSCPEIILVDSGSTDATLQVAAAAGAKITLLPEQFTHAASRNKGAEAAAGEYLLFMVQDALPLSTTYLYEMMNFLKTTGAGAVSCAEYPRGDSDLFYQYLIAQRYSQPGFNCDSVTQLDGTTTLSYLDLRSRAVLSNIACLISTDIFNRYGFSRSYGEDLDLAVRLIRDGQKLGFLHSTRVLHSHKRSGYYFLKRGYVDQLALADIFPDFVHPQIDDKTKVYAEILALQLRGATLLKLLDQQVYPLSHPKVKELFWSHMDRGEVADVQELPNEIRCLATLLTQSTHVNRARLTMVWPHAAQHLADFVAWFSGIYSESDRALAGEIVDGMQKILTLHSGMHLAYLFMSSSHERVDDSLLRIDNLLKAGV